MANGVYAGLIRHQLRGARRHRRTHTGATAGDVVQNALAGPVQDAANSLLSLSNPCDLGESCATVKTFQSAWNATGQGSTLTVDGYYGPNTQAAAAQILGPTAPNACQHTDYKGACAGAAPAPTPSPAPIQPVAPQQAGMFSGKLWWIVGALVVVALGFLGYKYEMKPHHR